MAQHSLTLEYLTRCIDMMQAPERRYYQTWQQYFQIPPPPDDELLAAKKRNAVYHKSIELLREWLSPAQREQFDRCTAFEVRGSHGGLYVVRLWHPYNVDYIDEMGHVLCWMCFTLPGMPLGDVMLAQKIALENDECEVWQRANISCLVHGLYSILHTARMGQHFRFDVSVWVRDRDCAALIARIDAERRATAT